MRGDVEAAVDIIEAHRLGQTAAERQLGVRVEIEMQERVVGRGLRHDFCEDIFQPLFERRDDPVERLCREPFLIVVEHGVVTAPGLGETVGVFALQRQQFFQGIGAESEIRRRVCRLPRRLRLAVLAREASGELGGDRLFLAEITFEASDQRGFVAVRIEVHRGGFADQVAVRRIGRLFMQDHGQRFELPRAFLGRPGRHVDLLVPAEHGERRVQVADFGAPFQQRSQPGIPGLFLTAHTRTSSSEFVRSAAWASSAGFTTVAR